MGLLSKEDKAAIRRGAWCNDTSVPEHIKANHKLPAERAIPIRKDASQAARTAHAGPYIGPSE